MRLHVCSIALLLSFASLSVTAAPPLLVKEHSDLSRLVVEGNETFTADQIRDELERNLELLALRRRLAPYQEFEQALARLIRDGYLQAGFADASVDVTFDEERKAIVARVHEGQRYEYGDIEVTGVAEDLSALIQRRLTRPYLPVDAVVSGVHDEETGDLLYGFDDRGQPVEETAAIWIHGKPANFHRFTTEGLRKAVLQAFWDGGFEGADVDVKLLPNGEIARLHVDVTDPGAPIMIDEVIVSGAERNSPESVLAWLGIQTPVQWTPDLRRRLNQKLWDCGRFQSFSVKVDTPEDLGDGDPTRLHVELIEYDEAPLLTEELNEVDRILCRAAQWLTSSGGRTSDLVFCLRSGVEHDSGRPLIQVQSVVSPARGLITELEWRTASEGEPRSYVFAMEPDRWFVQSGLTGRRLEYHFQHPPAIKLNLGLVGLPDPDSERHVSMRFGFGISSSHDGTHVRLAAAPMALLYEARFGEPECTISDGILSIRSARIAADFEAATGRWIRFDLLDRLFDDDSVAFRFEEQAFEREISRHRDRAGDQPVVNSIPAFVARELNALTSAEDAANAESLVTLTAFSSELATRLKQRDADPPGDENRRESFYIPWMPDEPPVIPMDMVGIVLGGNRLLFPRESSFGTFGRELLLAYVMRDRQATGNIERLLESYSTGPLMYWYAAEVFRFLSPVVAQTIAREGQKRLDRRRFESDCRQLLTRNNIVRDVIEDCAASLRGLDDRQLDALFSPVIPPEQRAPLIAALRRDGNSDLDVIVSLLGELWNAKLRELLRQRLITLSGGPEIRNATREPGARESLRATALAP